MKTIPLYRTTLLTSAVLALTAFGAGAAFAEVASTANAKPAPQQAVPRTVDQRAVSLLKNMSEYLGAQKQFTVRTHDTSEALLDSGQKLQFEAEGEVSLQRPNHLRTSRKGEMADIDFYYDGSTATLFGHRTHYYATTPAPSTIDAMIDDVGTRFDIDPPGADLLYSDIFAGLMPEVKEALYVGEAHIHGVKAHHLAFRTNDVDWQIWIADGDRPVPLKYLVTTKTMTTAPEFSVAFSDWNFSPKLNDATFKFTPPAGAQKIDFLNKQRAAQ
nr:DUF2092 domain-containing protein [Dyella sp. ASV24]